jgi:hypothetical protein
MARHWNSQMAAGEEIFPVIVAAIAGRIGIALLEAKNASLDLPCRPSFKIINGLDLGLFSTVS